MLDVVRNYEKDFALYDSVFQVFYQPQFHQDQSAPLGAEALLRSKKFQGNVAPVEYILNAENDRSIVGLTVWLASKVADDFPSLQRSLGIEHIAINMSPQTLESDEIVECIHRLLLSGRIRPEQLELEITEYDYSRFHANIFKNIVLFSKLGLRISIDDFGAGHTSLALLAELPVQGMKLDLSFAERMLDTRYQKVMRHLIAMSRDLSMRVCLEGVENRFQWLIAQDLGLDLIQGYFLSEARSATDLVNHYASDFTHRPMSEPNASFV